MSSVLSSSSGGRFDFDDGGTYCGGWNEGKAHGHGLCTGPKGQGHYAGTWTHGFEDCGVYTWPTGSTYEGQWGNGKRHGLGVETRGCWIYRGEWTDGFKGKYGVRQSIASGAKYDGTWSNGLQDGYGSETYADGGTFQGQWAKGMRHGYGVRSSAPFGLAAHRRPSVRKSNSMSESPSPERRPEDFRGGFVLQDLSHVGTWGRSLPDNQSKGSTLKNMLSKSKTRRDEYGEEFSEEEEGGSDSDVTEDSFMVQDETIDGNVIETYMGEWKNDKRSGFGIAERSDGIKYEGEWFNNKKFGYGLTTYKSGIEEYGKYKNNNLLQSGGKKHLFILRSGKFKERVQQAVSAAHRASQIALQKADIAISRTATARGKAEQAAGAAKQSRQEAEIARLVARQFAPEFQLPGPEILKRKLNSSQDLSDFPPHLLGDDSSHRSFHVSNPGEAPFGSSRDIYLRPQPEFDDTSTTYLSPEPPPQSAFLDIFRNNPDRRPSNAGFLRRPSAVNLRRPSTVVELKIVPSAVEQRPEFIPDQRFYHYQQQRHHPQQQGPSLTLQQVVDDHFHHYYEPTPDTIRLKNPVKKPGIDLTELSKIYGIPLSPPKMEDEEGTPFLPQRRSTMPTVLDPNLIQTENEGYYGDGMVRTGSLYTRKAESAVKASGIANTRKKSLPDISNITEPILSRETIAILSSQRREAIRRQEEEAERLRANPLLYLMSPEVWDWLASQQLVILVLVINIALGILFFKVIL